MIIREYLEKDFEDILNIENDSFIHPWTKENWRSEIDTNPVKKILVLEKDNKAIGFIDVWVTFDTSSIAQIAIKKEYRRNHYAEALYMEMEELLKKEDVQYITLEVRKSNIPAQEFYKKIGFLAVVVKPAYYDNGEDAIYMVKELVCQ